MVTISALAIAWWEAIFLCRHVEDVRYQMLHAPLTSDEKGVYEGAARGGPRSVGGFQYDGQYGKPRRMDM